MTAFTFTIRLRERSHVVGQAVVCTEARYASVWWRGQPRADRRFLLPAHWKAIELELDMKLPAAPLEDDSVIAHALIHESLKGRYLIHYLTQEPVGGELTGSGVVTVLDQRLRLLQV